MKNFIWILLVIGMCALGFFAGKSQAVKQDLEAQPIETQNQIGMTLEDQKNWQELKAKLEGVTADEIREYLRTQNADEKLKKADEILGKIVQALVANVGLRLSPQELATLKEGPTKAAEKNPENQPKAAATPAPLAEHPEVQQTIEKPKSSSRELLELRRQARQAATEEEAKKILDQLAKDYATRLQSSGTLNRQQIRELSGNFDGTLTYDKDNSSVRTTLSFNAGQVTSEKITGRAQVQIFDKSGQAVSTGRSRGDLGEKYTGTQVSIFVDIGENYMELVYFPNLDSFMGNYLQVQKGQYIKVGRVNLRRVN